MEDLILNYDEYKIVQKFQGRLESCYRVEILIPMLEKSSLCEKVVVGQICGREMDIQNVKDFIAQRMKRKRKRISDLKNLHSVPVITLSDSEEDLNSTSSSDNESHLRERPRGSEEEEVSSDSVYENVSLNPVIEESFKSSEEGFLDGEVSSSLVYKNGSPHTSKSIDILDESVCIIANKDEIFSNVNPKFEGECISVIENPASEDESFNTKTELESICIIENSDTESESDYNVESTVTEDESICIIDNTGTVNKSASSTAEDDSICIIDSSAAKDASIYIIESTSNSNNVNTSAPNSTRPEIEVSDDIIVLNADDVPRTSYTETVLSKQWYSWDSISNVAETKAQHRRGKRKNKNVSQQGTRHHLLAPSSTGSLDPAVCEVTSTTEERENNACPRVISQWNGSIKVVIQNDSNSAPDVPVISYRNARSEQPNFQKDSKTPDSVLIDNSKKRNEEPSSSNNSNPALDFVPIVYQNRRNAVLATQNKSCPAPNFIPIGKKRKRNQPNQQSKRLKCSSSKSKTSEAVVLGPETVLPSVPRRLRPIVIDGSNVARAHGNVSTFSSKGIQLCVEFFLKRGHKEITAFVPNFRRYDHTNRAVPTIDAAVLEELAKKQYVVFTPSRRLNGVIVSPYDDRFVVKLASENGGVIVSNDNFKDLVNESEAFKEAIEKRLLMFCFAGDKFMIPEDPLGQYGPKLDDYLSFPPEEQEPPN